jgi:hypothetical protein
MRKPASSPSGARERTIAQRNGHPRGRAIKQCGGTVIQRFADATYLLRHDTAR